MKTIMKVAEKSMGIQPNPPIKQKKDMLPGNLKLTDSNGKALSSVPSKALNTYRPNGDGRKIKQGILGSNSGTGESASAGRKMKPGQMTQKPAIGGERKMKSGPMKLKMSSGGLRKMKGGQPVVTNAAGAKIASSSSKMRAALKSPTSMTNSQRGVYKQVLNNTVKRGTKIHSKILDAKTMGKGRGALAAAKGAKDAFGGSLREIRKANRKHFAVK